MDQGWPVAALVPGPHRALAKGHGHLAYIEKRDGKTRPWLVIWREAGRKRSKSFRLKADAEAYRREVEALAARGHRPSDEHGRLRQAPRLADLMRAYLAEMALSQAPNTVRQKAHTYDALLRFTGPDAPLAALSKPNLLDWYVHLEEGRTLSTRSKMVGRVLAMARWASGEDDFADHMPRIGEIRLATEARQPTVAPTWAEMDAVLSATLDRLPGRRGQRQPHVGLYQLATVLRFTGLRVQQAMGLRWDDVDMAGATLLVRGELGKSKLERHGRRMPISAHLVAELAGWGRREGWVITGQRQDPEDRTARSRTMARAWARTQADPVVYAQRPHHAFRKGFASGLRRAGADRDAIEYLLGHTLGLVGVYQDPDALPLREAVDMVPEVGAVVGMDERKEQASE